MIYLRTPIGIWKTSLLPDETSSQVVSRFKNENHIAFAGNNYSLQDTITGRVIPSNEILLDERYFYLSALLTA
jgi:hypothetical protein